MILGHPENTSNYDEQNRIYMHKIGTPCNVTTRYNSGENLREHLHQITPTHNSGEYEDYSSQGQHKVDTGRQYSVVLCPKII